MKRRGWPIQAAIRKELREAPGDPGEDEVLGGKRRKGVPRLTQSTLSAIKVASS